jgi:hypothetical protein
MTLLEQSALGWQALRFTLREAARARLWLPFLVPLALQTVMITALALAAHPALSWLLAPLLTRLAGPQVLHYPDLFRALPDLVLRADLVVTTTAGALATAVSTRLFAQVFAGREPSLGEAFAESLHRWPAVLLAQLPAPLLLFALGLAFERLSGVRLSSLTRGMLPQVQIVLAIGVQAAFAYLAAMVVLGRRSPLEAWRGLPGTWRRGFVPALAAFTAATLVLLPLQTLLRQVAVIVDRGVPELAVATTALLFVGAAVASWLSTGAVTLVWVSAIATREEAQS